MTNLRKGFAVLCTMMLIFSITSIVFVGDSYAGDPVGAPGLLEYRSRCDISNCGTQNCIIRTIANCIGGYVDLSCSSLVWDVGS